MKTFLLGFLSGACVVVFGCYGFTYYKANYAGLGSKDGVEGGTSEILEAKSLPPSIPVHAEYIKLNNPTIPLEEIEAYEKERQALTESYRLKREAELSSMGDVGEEDIRAVHLRLGVEMKQALDELSSKYGIRTPKVPPPPSPTPAP